MLFYQAVAGDPLSREAMLIKHYGLMHNIPCYPYMHAEQIAVRELQNADLIQGSVESLTCALERLSHQVPEANYYPPTLHHYLGRSVWRTRYGTIPDAAFPVFVKSHAWKKLTGVVQNARDSSIPPTLDVWCSTPVNFIAEWRVYVQQGHIIHAARYDENDVEDLHLDWARIVKAIPQLDHEQFRVSYAFDWGLTADGQTLLVENNDAWAIGAYGDISARAYTEFLIARWKELTGHPAEHSIAIGV